MKERKKRKESSCLEVQLKQGWESPSKAKYKARRPIANKYREGQMERTLKRECKDLEIIEMEAFNFEYFIFNVYFESEQNHRRNENKNIKDLLKVKNKKRK